MNIQNTEQLGAIYTFFAGEVGNIADIANDGNLALGSAL